MTNINVFQLLEGQTYNGQRFGNTFEVAPHGESVQFTFPVEIAFQIRNDDDLRNGEGFEFTLTQDEIDDLQAWAEDNMAPCDACKEWHLIADLHNDLCGYCEGI